MSVAASLLIAASVTLIAYGFFHIGLAVGLKRSKFKDKPIESKTPEPTKNET